MYRIIINCTTEKELNYNNHKIDKKFRYNFDNINYIYSSYVIYSDKYNYKNKKEGTRKTLEFIITKLLNITELREFIEILKKLNFKSIDNTIIKMIDIYDNKCIYTTYYN
jgi:hypothetical protein